MAKIQPTTTRSAPAPAPTCTVSETDLADILDVTDRRVRQLVVEGIAIKTGPAEYDLAATLRAFARERAAKSARRVSVPAVAEAFAQAMAGAREERTANPKRDPLETLEGDFLSMLLHC
jgi:phage terminase Nu1 subunit (DNA packaging protein)